MQRELMKKMQEMQKKLTASMGQMEEELGTLTIEGTSGQGMVRVTVNGHGMPVAVKIDPKAVDPEDVEMLEDLILTATRDAVERSKSQSQDKMSKLTAGLPLPPGLF